MQNLSGQEIYVVCALVSVVAVFSLAGWAWTLTKLSTTIVGMLNLRREAARIQDEIDTKVRSRVALINRQVGEFVEEPLDPTLLGMTSGNLAQPPDLPEYDFNAPPPPSYDEWDAPPPNEEV